MEHQSSRIVECEHCSSVAATLAPFGHSAKKCEFKNHTNEPTKLLKTNEGNFYSNQIAENTPLISLSNQILENRPVSKNGGTRIGVVDQGAAAGHGVDGPGTTANGKV